MLALLHAAPELLAASSQFIKKNDFFSGIGQKRLHNQELSPYWKRNDDSYNSATGLHLSY